jgi:hypothetical protein
MTEPADVSETIRYAGERGVLFSPGYVTSLLRRLGAYGTRSYVDKLGTIMDAASTLGIECHQSLASRRLSLANGDVERAIEGFAAQFRRRSDRHKAACCVPIPPRDWDARSNAFAGCGCPHCSDRLANHMKRYINKMIASRFFDGLDREEARAEANLELIHSIETWPGGNFTGWFSARYTNRVRGIYRSRSGEERGIISLDADDLLSEDGDGRIVPLCERIPDRSADVLSIVLLREWAAEAELARRQSCTDRVREHTNDPPMTLRLVPSRTSRRLGSYSVPANTSRGQMPDGHSIGRHQQGTSVTPRAIRSGRSGRH